MLFDTQIILIAYIKTSEKFFMLRRPRTWKKIKQIRLEILEKHDKSSGAFKKI